MFSLSLHAWALMQDVNRLTRFRLEARGVKVETFAGVQVCLNGRGGPTCLTGPLDQENAAIVRICLP